MLASPSSEIHGLVGMRERVGMYGGEFQAGPLPGGGFRVTARLPLTEATTTVQRQTPA
nr:hypothetical protein [Catenulispora pinisilvae]